MDGTHGHARERRRLHETSQRGEIQWLHMYLVPDSSPTNLPASATLPESPKMAKIANRPTDDLYIITQDRFESRLH